MAVNRLSLEITDAQKTAVTEATNNLAEVTKDFNVVISKDELKSFQKISDGRIPFVEKVAQYAVENPEFLQPNADVPEFQRDFKTFKDTRELGRPIKQISNNFDTTMQVSGESLKFALDYYKSVQFQAKMGVPGAQTIYDDLRVLFEQNARNTEPNA